MDYVNSKPDGCTELCISKLYRYQWDQIHNPEGGLYWFQQDEDMMAKSDRVPEIINTFRDAKDGEKELSLISSMLYTSDNTKIGDATYKSIAIQLKKRGEQIVVNKVKVQKIDTSDQESGKHFDINIYDENSPSNIWYTTITLRSREERRKLLAYLQEKVVSDEILLDKEGMWWVTQFDEPLFGDETCWRTSCCNRAANKILENAGTSTNRTQQLIIAQSNNSDCSGLTGKTTEFKEAIRIIDKSLKEHKLPIMVGVQHPKKEEGRTGTTWYNECTGNIPNITNHYIIIVGKKYDNSKKQYYYLFYEVGTSKQVNGKSSENRLYINDNNNLIEGKTAYKTDYSGNYYIVTEVRKNIGQTY
jgi:hypothetical protein